MSHFLEVVFLVFSLNAFAEEPIAPLGISGTADSVLVSLEDSQKFAQLLSSAELYAINGEIITYKAAKAKKDINDDTIACTGSAYAKRPDATFSNGEKWRISAYWEEINIFSRRVTFVLARSGGPILLRCARAGNFERPLIWEEVQSALQNIVRIQKSDGLPPLPEAKLSDDQGHCTPEFLAQELTSGQNSSTSMKRDLGE